MNIFTDISPYWGIRSSLAIGDSPTAFGFFATGGLREADRLQLLCDFFWRSPLDSSIDSMLHKGRVQREVFWLAESIGYEGLPFEEEALTKFRPNKPMSLKLSRSLAVRDWCWANKYHQKAMSSKLSFPRSYSLEWLFCPYDPAVSLLFEASVPDDYRDRMDSVKLFWFYLINENGGAIAWNLLTKRIGISILFQEWSEIREKIKKSLLHLSGLPTQRNG